MIVKRYKRSLQRNKFLYFVMSILKRVGKGRMEGSTTTRIERTVTQIEETYTNMKKMLECGCLLHITINHTKPKINSLLFVSTSISKR